MKPCRGRRLPGPVALVTAAGLLAVAWLQTWPAPTSPVRTAAGDASDRLNAPAGRSAVRTKSIAASGETFEALAAKPDAEARSRGLEALLRDWTAEDAPGAAAFVLALADETLRRECLLGVMETWGEKDAAAALAWAKGAGFENAYEREIMMSMVCSTVARTDPRRAVELGAAHGLDGFVNGVMAALIGRWAEADLVTASSWLEAQEPGARRDALAESVALVVFEADPVAAARWVFDHTTAGEGRDRVFSALATRLAEQEPELALKWADVVPAGAPRERVLEEIERVRSWPRSGG